MTLRSLLLIFTLSTMAKASVTVIWTEDNNGVTASYSGSLATTSLFPPSSVLTPAPDFQPEGSVRNNNAFAYYDGSTLLSLRLETQSQVIHRS